MASIVHHHYCNSIRCYTVLVLQALSPLQSNSTNISTQYVCINFEHLSSFQIWTSFEKLISGKYLGAITHAALLKLVNDGLLFGGTCSDSFKELVIDRFDSAFLSFIEGQK